MCLEDLRLGKGRFVGRTVSPAGTTPTALGANPRRVALVYSLSAVTTFDGAGAPSVIDQAAIIAGDNAAANPLINIHNGSVAGVLRIEDVGQLILGSWSIIVGSVSGTAAVSLTEILTDVKAEPLGLGVE